MLTVEGELDDISGSGQTAAAHGLCTGIAQKNRQHLEVPGAGHYGIFSGRRWRDVVYPQVRQFILNHTPAAPKSAARAVVAASPVAAAKKPVAAKKMTAKAAPKAVAKPVSKPAATKAPAKSSAKPGPSKAKA
jgi:poly(3-hydroxybutyrate) depolymerase